MSRHDSRLDSFVQTLPSPGETAEDHLTHTLAAFAHLDDLTVLPTLGLPVGFLRNLSVDAIRADVARVAADGPEDADYAVVATVGVYGNQVRTGLTWGDLRALTA